MENIDSEAKDLLIRLDERFRSVDERLSRVEKNTILNGRYATKSDIDLVMGHLSSVRISIEQNRRISWATLAVGVSLLISLVGVLIGG